MILAPLLWVIVEILCRFNYSDNQLHDGMIAAVIVCMKNGRKEKGWDEAAHEQEAEAKKLSLPTYSQRARHTLPYRTIKAL